MKRLLVIGPLPPPHHGVSVSTGLVLANPYLRERFVVDHFDTSDPRTMQNVGRWDARNAVGGLSAVVRLTWRLRGEPGVVYLPISQGLPGLTRDTLFIRIASACGWKVAAHLRGSELRDIYLCQPRPVRAWLTSSCSHLSSIAVLGESLRYAVAGLLPGDRVAVVPNGTPDPRPNDKPSGDLGLYMSNFRPRKGVREALTAAATVARQRPNARFIFAGDCPDESLAKDLKAIAAQAPGQIELRGGVTGREKRDLLLSAGFFVFPPSEPEGHPRVVLEAIAAGLPVIATDRGAIAETVVDGESGFILPRPDPADLADRILRLHDDAELRQAMSKAARARYLERFTQETSDRALTEWLGSLATSR